MGDAVKVVVGVALIATGLGAINIGFMAGSSASLAVGAALATTGSVAAVYAAVGVMALAGISMVGGALTPDIPDFGSVASYAGQKLQTRKTNTAPVPICYGRNRLAGNIVWETTGNQITANSDTAGKNRDYWAVIALCGHDIGTINGIYSNDEALTDRGSNIYTGTYVGAKANYQSSAVNLQSLVFSTNDGTNTSTGSDLGFDSISFPGDVTYITVHQIYTAPDNQQLKSISVDFLGKPVRSIASGAFSSTTNDPTNVEIVADVLTDLLEVQDSALDLASFTSAKADVIANGLADCNLALVQQFNIQSVLQDVMASGRLSLARSVGEWVIYADKKQKTTLKRLTEQDIVNGTISVNMPGNNDIANSITVNWVNPADSWLKSDYTISDSQLITNDGRDMNKALDVKSVIVESQAQKIAEITLNSMRYSEDESGNRVKQTPLVASFGTTTKHADIEVGDVVEIEHFLFDRVRKFLILSVETNQSGIVSFSSREYCETHYKDTSGNYII